MMKPSTLAIGCAIAFAGAVAWACGPDFPSQMLDNRAATLAAVPQNTFAFEAAHLLPATDGLKAVESGPYDAEPKAGPDLPADQAEKVKALMAAGSGDEAYSAGAGLPEDVRLYAAGAVDWNLAMKACASASDADGNAGGGGDASCTTFDGGALNRAQTRFEAVLALPQDQAVRRGAWAAYMLGRSHALRAGHANGAGFTTERDASSKAFQQVRTRVLAGASDAQGLAVASFGEEAALSLYVDGKPCLWVDFVNDRECVAKLAPGDLKHAIALYAAQAGHGSQSAVQSLASIAGAVLGHPEQVAALVDGPVSQRLLVTYALARVAPQTADGKPEPVLVALVEALAKVAPDKIASADRLASLNYQLGRYDDAERLVAKADGPLAAWVRAKLALRKGDRDAAARAYAEAAQAFPRVDDPKASLEPSSIEQVMGERGVLSLARGEYVEAMTRMYEAATKVGGDGNVYDYDGEVSGAGYGNDMNYIAERVLTVDELKSFVDAHAPASPPPATKPDDKDAPYQPLPVNDRLRWLLARRLMRAERYDDAYAYFPQGIDKRFSDVGLRATAKAYAEALHDGDHAWTDIGKAEARYTAAKIAREHGMELIGYEQGPDYADNGGNFQGGSGQSMDSLKGDDVTEGERQRFQASAAQPDRRLHYRYLASDKAASAADLLPPRSQAFAATLCMATHWMLEGPPDYSEADDGDTTKPLNERQRRAKAYYARYVKQGPYVEWADSFGWNCEEPDFARARELKRAEQIVAAKRFVRHWLPVEIGVIVLLLAGIGWRITRRRKSM